MANYLSSPKLAIIFSSSFILGLINVAANSSATPTQDNVRYVGATTCQSSMCHGGASTMRCQYTVWSQQDFHSRAYATLVTPRSARMAESLGLPSATESARCTTCHAPYEAIPAPRLASTVDVTEGVSCEQCHNAAESWLRGHTRPDWTYADRIHAGLRDLRSAYVRANTCVTCHQVVAADILKAGHPELIFELDGQSASEPRHWQEKDTWFGPKAWLVGQLAALREISLQLSNHGNDDPDLATEQKALVWVLDQIPGIKSANLPDDQPNATAAWSNQLALSISGQAWNRAMSTQGLTALSSTFDSFLDNAVPVRERAMRAERLVLALDRFSKSLKTEGPGQADLTNLFASVQNRDQFDPKEFSSQLHQFADDVSPKQ